MGRLGNSSAVCQEEVIGSLENPILCWLSNRSLNKGSKETEMSEFLKMNRNLKERKKITFTKAQGMWKGLDYVRKVCREYCWSGLKVRKVFEY